MADTFQPVAPRPAPVRTEGFVPWVKRNLFADWKNGLTTVLLVALALYVLPGLADWGLTQAVFPANAEACQAARGSGACWGVITEKWRVIIFGRYPFEQQWRPEVAKAAPDRVVMVIKGQTIEGDPQPHRNGPARTRSRGRLAHLQGLEVVIAQHRAPQLQHEP